MEMESETNEWESQVARITSNPEDLGNQGTLFSLATDSFPPRDATWNTFDACLAHIREESSAKGFKVSRNFRNHAKHQFAAIFGEEVEFKPVSRRGHFYCGEKGCKWRVQVRFDDNDNLYKLDEELTVRAHSHVVKAELPRASQSLHVKNESAMSLEEVEFVMSLGPASLGIPKIRALCQLRFPNRVFDAPLLHRILKKGFNRHFGTDPDCINKFMQAGKAISNEGGVFDFKLTSDGRLDEIFVMKQSQLL